MTETFAATERKLTLTTRPGASRKLLQRKAAEAGAPSAADSEPIESLFPADAPTDGAAVVADPPAPAPEMLSEEALANPEAVAPDIEPSWSDEDERALKIMQARRKASGYQRRGKDVSGQTLRVGDLTPNPDTIVAVIVGLVASRGSVSRADLVALMAEATYPHPKAQPESKSWCQGYCAGAVRAGYLALSDGSHEAQSTADTPR